jgi:hypothetical protein
MQAGSLTVDQPFVDRFFQQLQIEAQDAGQRGDPISQLGAYRSLSSDFRGLKDVSAYDKKLAQLKQSPGLKSALKNERQQMDEQESLEAEIGGKLQALTSENSYSSPSLRRQIAGGMQQLKSQATGAKTEAKRQVAARAFSGAWAEGIEAGQQQLVEKHFDRAEAYFELMASVSDEPWPMLLLAETQAARGNRKQAIKDLRDAIRRGLNSAYLLEKDRNLQSLEADPEFQRLVGELRALAH